MTAITAGAAQPERARRWERARKWMIAALLLAL